MLAGKIVEKATIYNLFFYKNLIGLRKKRGISKMNKIKKCKSLMSLTEDEHNRFFTKFYDWKINGGSEKGFHKDAKRRYQVNFLMFCFKYRSI